MAIAGLRIRNSNNHVVIDSNHSNLLFVSKRELTTDIASTIKQSTSMYTAFGTYVTIYDITSFVSGIAAPVLAIQVDTTRMSTGIASFVRKADAKIYLHILHAGNAVFTGTLYIFAHGVLPAVVGAGLRVFNPTTREVAFDSRFKYMRPVGICDGEQDLVLPNADTKSYAVLCGVRGVATMVHSKYATLSYDHYQSKYIQAIVANTDTSSNTIVLKTAPESKFRAHGDDFLTTKEGWIQYSLVQTGRGRSSPIDTRITFTSSSAALILDVTDL